MNPFFIVETVKPFEQACADLQTAAKEHDFGILAVHDLGETLRSKGIVFTENCRVFEVCNPRQAAKALNLDIALNMALPCRISVYTEAGQTHTRIGMIKPELMLRNLSADPELTPVAQDVEASMMAIIKAAAGS